RRPKLVLVIHAVAANELAALTRKDPKTRGMARELFTQPLERGLGRSKHGRERWDRRRPQPIPFSVDRGAVALVLRDQHLARLVPGDLVIGVRNGVGVMFLAQVFLVLPDCPGCIVVGLGLSFSRFSNGYEIIADRLCAIAADRKDDI